MDKQDALAALRALMQVVDRDAVGEVHEKVGGGWLIHLTTKDGQWISATVDGAIHRFVPAERVGRHDNSVK